MAELRINGTDVGNVQIRQLKPGVSIDEAKKKLSKDGLDQVFFTRDGTHYVASGENLNLSAVRGVIPTTKQQLSLTDKDGQWVVTYSDQGLAKTATLPVTEVDGHKVRIEGIQDEFQSAREGAKKRVAGALAGVFGAGMFGGAVGVVLEVFDGAASAITRKEAERGNWIPAAMFGGGAAIIGGIYVAHGAVKGGLNRVDMAPLNAITQ